MSLNTYASAGVGGGSEGDYNRYSQAFSDFSDPLMLSDSGPLFNFSEPGWTVDSLNGCVVNNLYVCAPGETSAVPEPGNLALLASALVGLVAVSRGRRTLG
jgi:hypothetical protein